MPYLEAARPSLAAGYVPGGIRRNLDWVRPHLTSSLDEDELLLLADAQTSGGLLVAGELPGVPGRGGAGRRVGRRGALSDACFGLGVPVDAQRPSSSGVMPSVVSRGVAVGHFSLVDKGILLP